MQLVRERRLVPVMCECLKEAYSEERANIHGTDLVLCLRKAAFQKQFGSDIDYIELNFYLLGRSMHDALQQLAKRRNFEAEKKVFYKTKEGHEVECNIDLWDPVNEIPFEIKSIRSKALPQDKPKPHQVEQLAQYCIVTGTRVGYIIYCFMMNYDVNLFDEWKLTLDDRDVANYEYNMNFGARNLALAMKYKDPALAMHVADDPDKRWLCNYCQFKETCTDLRMKNGEFINHVKFLKK